MTIVSVDQLIHGSYRIIGIKSDGRNLSDTKIEEGLGVLNELLDSYFSESDLIAYYDEIQFNLVTGQKSYEFSNEGTPDVSSNKIAELKHVNIIDSNVSYPISIEEDYIDWQVRRVVNTQRRPAQCYLQNENFKSIIIFDVLSDQPYICNVKAKFALSNVEVSTSLRTVPVYYTNFFKYALGKELNSIYPGSIWNEKLERRFLDAKKNIQSTSDEDLLQVTSVGLTRKSRYYGINPY